MELTPYQLFGIYSLGILVVGFLVGFFAGRITKRCKVCDNKVTAEKVLVEVEAEEPKVEPEVKKEIKTPETDPELFKEVEQKLNKIPVATQQVE